MSMMLGNSNGGLRTLVQWLVLGAIIGAVLGINPFDEPNVTESKDNTKRPLDEYRTKGRLPEEEPTLEAGVISLYGGSSGAKELAGAPVALLGLPQPGRSVDPPPQGCQEAGHAARTFYRWRRA